MEFAVNYSPTLANLVRAGQVQIDRFKCPAWPGMLAEASQILPVYIHFPLSIGSGIGCPMNDEKHEPVNLDWLAEMQAQYATPHINTHLITPGEVFPENDSRDHSAAVLRKIVDYALRDLEPLIKRFGAEKVLVENVINERGWMDLCVMPETLSRLLEESGCGFLFDLSHGRLAAANLNLEPRQFISAMPLERMGEMHITGTRVLEGDLLELVRSVGDPYAMIQSMTGRKIDHLPMEADDWVELEWAAGQIKIGAWREPWVASFEYGGVGAFWEQLTSQEIYLEQVPRMGRLLTSG